MIRRSPTRIELKLEDLADFDYIQKFEKKKAPNSGVVAVGGISAADAQKFIRQDRIGFRPIRAGAATGSGSGTSGNWPGGSSSGGAAIEEVDLAGNGVMTAEASTSTLEGQERGETSGNTTGTTVRAGVTRGIEMEVGLEDGEPATSSNISVEGNASNVDMSVDESL